MLTPFSADTAAQPATTSQLQQSPVLGSDEYFMLRAQTLAEKGINTTHPNPRVGCVVVQGGAVVGEGWHRFVGEAHAEIIALEQAGEQAKDATMYATLEPCCHHGRTPPCVDAVIKSGIKRAVIAMQDPNPLVNGASLAKLERAGVAVTLGVGKQSAQTLNRGFYKRMVHGRPWVTLKMAITLDGKTAMANGESQWLSSAAARDDAHQLRAASSAILTGVGTVVRDNPSMTARLKLPSARQPLRVILDSNLSTPADSNILKPPGRALIITTNKDKAKAMRLSSDSVEIVVCCESAGQVDLHQALAALADREINELLLEAGARLSGSMLQQGLVDQLVVYLAPDLLGNTARGMFDLTAVKAMADKLQLAFSEVRMIDRDLRLSLDVVAPPPQGLTNPFSTA